MAETPNIQDWTQVRAGDMLAWSNNRSNKVANFFQGVIRYFTKSTWAHVAVVAEEQGILFIYEATVPKIKRTPLSERTTNDTWWLSMGVQPTEDAVDFLNRQLGKRYSFIDGVRAFLGMTTFGDDRWQCAEYVAEFYRLCNVDLGDIAIPDKVVYRALDGHERHLTLLSSID